jgi:hypothetical protein
MRYTLGTALLWAVFASPALTGNAALFTDSFNSAGSAANYVAISTDAPSSFPTFAYDYSAMGIPSPAGSPDSLRLGLKLDANFSAPNAAEAITMATIASYSGDYTVSFDAWLNVNGPFPDGGSGSTNFLTAGVGHNGTSNNNAVTAGSTGNGGWIAVDGENGNGIDYRWYKDGTLQGVATAQYAAGTASNARNGLHGYYDQFGSVNVSNLPVQGANNGGPAQQNGTSFAGSFGMAWHKVRLDVKATGGTGGAAAVHWFIDNLHIGTLDAGANGSYSASGKVTLGYSDPTTNGSDLPTHSFALIDNLEITPEPTSALLTAIGLAFVSICRRR